MDFFAQLAFQIPAVGTRQPDMWAGGLVGSPEGIRQCRRRGIVIGRILIKGGQLANSDWGDNASKKALQMNLLYCMA